MTARRKAYRWRLQSYTFHVDAPGDYYLTFDGRWSLHRSARRRKARDSEPGADPTEAGAPDGPVAAAQGPPAAGRVREGGSPLP